MRIQEPRFGLPIGVIVLALAAKASAQGQTSQDEYKRDELLAPDTGSFKIDYEVTATTACAKSFWNPIRKGSVASDEAVYDLGGERVSILQSRATCRHRFRLGAVGRGPAGPVNPI